MRGLGPDNLRALDLYLLEEVQVKDPDITQLWSYQQKYENLLRFQVSSSKKNHPILFLLSILNLCIV